MKSLPPATCSAGCFLTYSRLLGVQPYKAPSPNSTRLRPLKAAGITRAILGYLQAHGFSAWAQPNRGEYDPTIQRWRPHPNARRGVPNIIGFRFRDAMFIGVEVKPVPTVSGPSRPSS